METNLFKKREVKQLPTEVVEVARKYAPKPVAYSLPYDGTGARNE